MLPLLYQRSFTGDKVEAVKKALEGAQLEAGQWYKKTKFTLRWSKAAGGDRSGARGRAEVIAR